MRPPVQILKFLAIDVQLFTLKFYNNIIKTGSEFKETTVCTATDTLLLPAQNRDIFHPNVFCRGTGRLEHSLVD